MDTIEKVTSGGEIDLSVELGPLKLKTPIIAASGTFGYGIEYEGLADFSAYGAIILKAVSLEPRRGNPPPRIVETPAGMLNCIGLENPGVEAFIKEKLPRAARLGVPLIANLVGERVKDYVRLAEILDGENALVALEINASCPNVEHGYSMFSTTPSAIEELVKEVRKATKKPLIVKLSPNVTDIVPLAKASLEAGGDILDLCNTFLGMSICIETGHSRLSRDYGGLSGRAIRPLALRIVHQAVSATNAPIIGTGGIYETSDAIEFFIAGARAVSLGTVQFIHPDQARKIVDELNAYLKTRGISLNQLIGSYRGPACVNHSDDLP